MTNLKALAPLLLLSIGCGSSESGSDTATGGSAGQVTSVGGAGAGGSAAGSSGAAGGAAGGSGGQAAGGGGASGAAQAGSGGGGASQAGGGSGGAAGSAGGGGAAGSAGAAGAGGAGNAEPSMTFFVTSMGSGALGGNLGGLTGADAICQAAAQAVGEGAKTWHAYLSTAAEDAVDRIGMGPWYNYNLDMVAADLETLHTDGLPREEANNLVMDELGEPVPSGEHDIFTGSMEDGTVQTGMTCLDWTSDSDDDMGQVGHSDIPAAQFSPSWNSAHETAGCSESGVEQRGGSGRLYCFAID